MASSSSDANDDLNTSLDTKNRSRGGGDDLDSRQARNNDLDGKPSRPVPAWKLREQMKHGGGPSSMPSNHVRTFRKPKPQSKLEDEDSLDSKQKPTSRSYGGNRKADLDDPSLPPAFRAAFLAQRKKSADDFMNLTSVHTSKTNSSIPQSPADTAGLDDSDSDSSFDGHDSFASLGSDDDEDDEAYREGRNQIARQEIESQQSSSRSRNSLKSKDFRKRGGMNGIGGAPLDFIAE